MAKQINLEELRKTYDDKLDEIYRKYTVEHTRICEAFNNTITELNAQYQAGQINDYNYNQTFYNLQQNYNNALTKLYEDKCNEQQTIEKQYQIECMFVDRDIKRNEKFNVIEYNQLFYRFNINFINNTLYIYLNQNEYEFTIIRNNDIFQLTCNNEQYNISDLISLVNNINDFDNDYYIFYVIYYIIIALESKDRILNDIKELFDKIFVKILDKCINTIIINIMNQFNIIYNQANMIYKSTHPQAELINELRASPKDNLVSYIDRLNNNLNCFNEKHKNEIFNHVCTCLYNYTNSEQFMLTCEYQIIDNTLNIYPSKGNCLDNSVALLTTFNIPNIMNNQFNIQTTLLNMFINHTLNKSYSIFYDIFVLKYMIVYNLLNNNLNHIEPNNILDMFGVVFSCHSYYKSEQLISQDGNAFVLSLVTEHTDMGGHAIIGYSDGNNIYCIDLNDGSITILNCESPIEFYNSLLNINTFKFMMENKPSKLCILYNPNGIYYAIYNDGNQWNWVDKIEIPRYIANFDKSFNRYSYFDGGDKVNINVLSIFKNNIYVIGIVVLVVVIIIIIIIKKIKTNINKHKLK